MVVSSLPPTSNHKRTNQSMDAALVLFEDGSTMSCWYCRSTLLGWIGNWWNCVNLSRERRRWGFREIVGMGVLDVWDYVRTGVN